MKLLDSATDALIAVAPTYGAIIKAARAHGKPCYVAPRGGVEIVSLPAEAPKRPRRPPRAQLPLVHRTDDDAACGYRGTVLDAKVWVAKPYSGCVSDRRLGGPVECALTLRYWPVEDDFALSFG